VTIGTVPGVKPKLIVILACGLAIGLPLAACGGGDDNGDSASTPSATTPVNGGEPLSKQDYLSQGDQICAQGTLNIAQKAEDRFGGQPSSTDEVETFAKEDVAPTLQDDADKLRALPPPKGDEETVNAIYDALDEGAAKLKAHPELLLQSDAGGAFDKADKLATDYGFQQCGEK
jgi:hypothetical protein